MNKPVLYISIGALVAFLLSAIVVSTLNLVNNGSSNESSPSTNTEENNNFFTSQSATLEGTILDVKDNMITIKNNNETSKTFSISQMIQITKFDGQKPNVSTNLQEIELNKKASVILNMREGQFEVVNITYIPERVEPLIPPVQQRNSSASATPR